MPAELRGDVVEIVGLTATRHDNPAATPGTSTAQVAANPERCAEAGAELDAIHTRYGVDRLAARGLRGEGMTIAVPSPDTVDDRALALWVDCIALPKPKIDATDLDLLGPVNPDQELDLDLDTIVATAPSLSEIRAIGMDPVGWVGEPYLRAIDDNLTRPDVLSSSETFCERDLPAGDISLTEWVLAAAAAEGMTVVVASGDAGSTGCLPDPAKAVEYPASSAWVTAVGGTQALANDPAGFEAWNQQAKGVATGGGDSASIARPAWQPDIGAMRRVPDVAYVAAPAGWPPMPVCLADRPCDWHRLGGTSASAPLFASAVALAKQHARQAGRTPPGFLNPALYRFAGAAPPEAVGDVAQGNNDVRDAGCCEARPGHDPATGWGSIDMVALTDHLTAIAPAR